MFLLGDTFLRNFYSVYDFTNKSVKLAINRHSANIVGKRKRYSLFDTFLTYTFIMLFIYILCILLYKYFKKQQKK